MLLVVFPESECYNIHTSSYAASWEGHKQFMEEMEKNMLQLNQLNIELKKWNGVMAGTEEFRKMELAFLKDQVCRTLGIKREEADSISILKKSLDARKKNEIKYSYSVLVETKAENKILKTKKRVDVIKRERKGYEHFPSGKEKLSHSPLIIGSGPAGLFCGLFLAEKGYEPVILERGGPLEDRIKEVEGFWENGRLNPECNVQFGEGGAGTFSDGKLNTAVKDPSGRNQEVLRVFAQHGAPEEILYLNKPHIGTDRLRNVVVSIRERIKQLGGQFRFYSKLTDIHMEDHKIQAAVVNHCQVIPCEVLVLAIGHSARDTFSALYEKGLFMTPKAFAIGLRMEHTQQFINESQYGQARGLPAADYKLTWQASNGRGVYSFCMCPGGFVVNASSERERLAINGMSNYGREERNGNSAIIVSVTPEDFLGSSPLAGMEYQRKWEGLAYAAGQGKIPVQRWGDFLRSQKTSQWGQVAPNMKGAFEKADLRQCLPEYVIEALIEGIGAFGRKIKGFDHGDGVLSGVETRTSSPVRMVRNQELEANIAGIYPCGEGAGYAGGITSAAMDGMKIYEGISDKYRPKG